MVSGWSYMIWPKPGDQVVGWLLTKAMSVSDSLARFSFSNGLAWACSHVRVPSAASGDIPNVKALFKSAWITSAVVPLAKAKHMVEPKMSVGRVTQGHGYKQSGTNWRPSLHQSSTEALWSYITVFTFEEIKTLGGQETLAKPHS